ncbi:MAG TPA: hypothetical protein VMG10_32810 [Gemmataceae bacterium]|nr:hypothetical protein [Gemmataceae bacterium]
MTQTNFVHTTSLPALAAPQCANCRTYSGKLFYEGATRCSRCGFPDDETKLHKRFHPQHLPAPKPKTSGGI